MPIGGRLAPACHDDKTPAVKAVRLTREVSAHALDVEAGRAGHRGNLRKCIYANRVTTLGLATLLVDQRPHDQATTLEKVIFSMFAERSIRSDLLPAVGGILGTSQ